MSWIKLEENRERVLEALESGYVDEVFACRATRFDELAGAMKAFGYFDQLEAIKIDLDKGDEDVPNELVKRELAVLPLLRIPNPHQAPTYLFQDHGVLKFIGFTMRQIGEGFNDKGRRSPRGEPRMKPHHRDTLYNGLKAVVVDSLSDFRDEHQAAFGGQDLLRSGEFVVDGTGLKGSDRHVVVLQQVGEEVPPFIPNWRIQGPGQELAAGKEMVEELVEECGRETVEWLYVDAAYVDGKWVAKLQQQDVGAMVRITEKMKIYRQMKQLSQLPECGFETHRYVRTIQGHKEVHEVEIALFSDLLMWPSYREGWAESGVGEGELPGLWGFLVREEWEDEEGEKKEKEWGVVCTKPLTSREAAYNRWRTRWDVENKGFRELNQGGWLESQTWGRSESAIQTAITLKIGAHNCYCLMRTDLGERLAVTGLRDLQHYLYGAPPVIMVVVEDEYGLFTAEELVGLLGVDIAERLSAGAQAGLEAAG